MIRHPQALALVLVLAAALAAPVLLGGCSKKKPTLAKDPPTPGEPAAPPDSLLEIGRELSQLVRLWVLTLSQVETEESADKATGYFEIMENQFESLAQRAAVLPPLDPDEFKRVDREVDGLIAGAASGLENQRQRIFVLPDQIKSKVLPAHDRLLDKFRALCRSMLNKRAQPTADEKNQ